MNTKRNGVAMLIAPFNPVPAAVRVAEQLVRLERIDPKIREVRSLMEGHFSQVDESTFNDYVGPLLWARVRDQWTASLASSRGLLGCATPTLQVDGNLVLAHTEMLLAGPLSHDSITELENEVARWSARSTRNSDQLNAMREELRYFQDECSKLQIERLSFWQWIVVATWVISMII